MNALRLLPVILSFLLLGALEWLRTLYSVAAMRIAFAQPWTQTVW